MCPIEIIWDFAPFRKEEPGFQTPSRQPRLERIYFPTRILEIDMISLCAFRLDVGVVHVSRKESPLDSTAPKCIRDSVRCCIEADYVLVPLQVIEFEFIRWIEARYQHRCL